MVQEIRLFLLRIFACCVSLLIGPLVVSCGGGSGSSSSSSSPIWYQPSLSTTWNIQLQANAAHPLNTSYSVDLYDVDLFDTDSSTIAALHADGRKVICYFSTAWEDWRSDAGDFPASVLGNDMSGWPGEKWVDIRDPAVLAIMTARMDTARAKGCDGVDPDNVNAFEQGQSATGFNLSSVDQLNFNRALAAAAHERGLAIGLKNDMGQISTLVADFDFSINEQCYFYGECDLLQPFVTAGKPVFHLEYDTSYRSDPTGLCADSLARSHRTLVMSELLDDTYRHSCD